MNSLALVASACLFTQPTEEPRFDGLILAAADADMVAFAYADGHLEPLRESEGSDALILIAERDGQLVILDQQPAPNSVVSWPQIIEGVAESGAVYVVETRGSLPRSTDQVSSAYSAFPAGRSMRAYQISGGQLIARGESEGGLNPQSVSRGSDPDWVLLASEDEGTEAIFVNVSGNGTALSLRTVDLDPDYRPGGENRLRGLFWSPNGQLVAANVENQRLEVYRVERDSQSDPIGLTKIENSLEIGVRWSVGKWTPDGRHFLITDTAWPEGGAGLAMLTQSRGELISVAVSDSGDVEIADRLRVGLSPEGFDIAPNGRLAVTVNMGRTYLPDNPILSLWPGRTGPRLAL